MPLLPLRFPGPQTAMSARVDLGIFPRVAEATIWYASARPGVSVDFTND